MGTQPAIPSDQHNLSHLDLTPSDALNHQRIPRPNRREHAPTCGCKTKGAEGAQNLARKLAFHTGGGIRWGAAGLPHETFVFWLQLSELGLILPQESAEVTKTCS